MPKKQSTNKRTQVKDLPKKGKKLSKGDMKKVKGGVVPTSQTQNVFEREQEMDIRSIRKP